MKVLVCETSLGWATQVGEPGTDVDAEVKRGWELGVKAIRKTAACDVPLDAIQCRVEERA